MKNPVQKLTASVAVLVATSAIGQAQPAAATTKAPAPPPTPFEQFAKDTKNPTDWLNWGADLRLRREYYNVAGALNEHAAGHEQDYYRFRGRVWTSITPVTDLSINGRLSAEPRIWNKPPSATSQMGPRTGWEEKYAIADLMNVKWGNIASQPFSFTFGRQEIMLGDPGDWWLVMDGTPADGSWTFFFDSARMSFEMKEMKTKLDLIYLCQSAMPDEWLPTLGRSRASRNADGTLRPYSLSDQDEQGVILYASNKSIKNTQLDGYFIYKRDNKISEVATGDSADIYTLGAKITGTPATHLAYSIEGAYQFGSKQDARVRTNYVNSAADWRNISVYGGKTSLTYLFKDKLNNQISLMGEFLSGDDPNTPGKDEMFDILWGRYPRWTELGAFNFGAETGRGAQMSNLGRVGASWSISPVKGMTFSAMYNALFAPKDTPTRSPVDPTSPNYRFSNSGTFRGHYLQTILAHKFNKNVSALVKGELQWMGDYYDQRDMMSFVRAELAFTF